MNKNFDYCFYMGSLTREKIFKHMPQQKSDKEVIKALQRQLIKKQTLRGKIMKKQYRYIEASWWQIRLYIYHDGELVDSKKIPVDEMEEVIEKLELDGYTYGYIPEEVEKAKKQYEEILANTIQ